MIPLKKAHFKNVVVDPGTQTSKIEQMHMEKNSTNQL